MNAGRPFGRARYPWVRELSQTDLVTRRVWLKANFAKLAAVVPNLIHYATENSLLHALRAREFFLEGYSDQSQKDRRRVK
jgi:hypothetical protein